MNLLLTDDAVAALPLHGGRAALLEEIVGTPVSAGDPGPVRPGGTRPRDSRRWLAPLAAAAAVGALVMGSALRVATLRDDPHPRPPAAATPRAGGFHAVLDADGWTLTGAYQDSRSGMGEVGYRNGSATLSIDWYPASDYAQRYDSRRRMTHPPSDGRPVEVLGLPGRMWSYTADDHTVLRPVQDGHFLEIRGSGTSTQAFIDVLSRLRLVDAAGFDASLPKSFVTDAERNSKVDALLDGIGRYAQPLLPAGVSRDSITSEQSDPVHVGSDVINQVTCAWLAQYADARRTGDQSRAEEAVAVMKTSRQWPVLTQLKDASDVPEWVWAVTDEMSAGQIPQGWRPTCSGYLP
ncbi:hypothetical protein GCM10009798_04860 [Nocardioides panacihumi]|uniref:Uncharacterized protein n=1 Tax=Nocardioides panacihumi TaxID=400774 RepID=A0ABN2QBK3_9ACTN